MPISAVIFDLDGTLLNTRAPQGLRDARRWGDCRRHLDHAEEFTVPDGDVPVVALPAQVTARGKPVGLLTSPPTRYEALMTMFGTGIVLDNQVLSASPAAKEIAARNFARLGDKGLLAYVDDHLLREWTYKSFNCDAVVAEEMGSTVNITARFWPTIDRADLGDVNAGDHALECFVANLG